MKIKCVHLYYLIKDSSNALISRQDVFNCERKERTKQLENSFAALKIQ